MNKINSMLSSYLQLTKPRIGLLVIVTAYLGYYLGLRSVDSHMLEIYEWINLFHIMFGMFISCSGACAFNQIFEVSIDAKMDRTKKRPLPLEKISISNAYKFAMFLFLLSSIYLYVFQYFSQIYKMSHLINYKIMLFI